MQGDGNRPASGLPTLVIRPPRRWQPIDFGELWSYYVILAEEWHWLIIVVSIHYYGSKYGAVTPQHLSHCFGKAIIFHSTKRTILVCQIL